MHLAAHTERQQAPKRVERRLLHVRRVVVRLNQAEQEVHCANTEALLDAVVDADIEKLQRVHSQLMSVGNFVPAFISSSSEKLLIKPNLSHTEY